MRNGPASESKATNRTKRNRRMHENMETRLSNTLQATQVSTTMLHETMNDTDIFETEAFLSALASDHVHQNAQIT